MPIGATFRRTPEFSLSALIDGLLNGNRTFLGRAITLIESSHPEDKKLANLLLDKIITSTGKSFRIGISGVPGVGKSTFIDVFGSHLTSIGKKVAVLSVDPSSSRTKGSILGDKTRMGKLANDPSAFIRPSAAGKSLGGVASNTREAILICEAAGYDVIIVETVGVGQSETLVREMVDYFVLLMLAGGGDELQGIKRGIMEMADHLLINKADGNNLAPAKRAREEYKNAIHLFPPTESGWTIPVAMCSSTEGSGISETWIEIEKFQELVVESGWFEENRKSQLISWFHEQVKSKLEQDFYSNSNIKQSIKKIEEDISSSKIPVRNAVSELFKNHIVN